MSMSDFLPPARARTAFSDVSRPADAELRRLWNTNSSALLLYQGEADEALDILEPMSRRSLPQNHRLRVEALRADAWIQKQEPARVYHRKARFEELGYPCKLSLNFDINRDCYTSTDYTLGAGMKV